MNGSSCSEVTQPQGIFFLKVRSLSSVASLVSILTLLVFAEVACQTETGQSLSGQAEVPKHVILASGDVIRSHARYYVRMRVRRQRQLGRVGSISRLHGGDRKNKRLFTIVLQ